MNEEIKELLEKVVKLQTEESFQKEYRDNVKPSEALGVALSKYFKWNGQQIFETALSGFEDSNFHTFNDGFQKLWNKECNANKYECFYKTHECTCTGVLFVKD